MALRVASSLPTTNFGDFTDALNGKRVLGNFYLNAKNAPVCVGCELCVGCE